eukprot:CAMPEP_0197032550 /NCGR_PEP_ID=MMETSP1384-20130603/11211_1 /TAXON_ID=29189 /ORGANISM="Ammonia sp." /LENGTH=217 /DNA_ID=CAMNT_0042462235 /DNA_START=30 /DNA_END=683 /DNA_ORIENTATION=+
MYANFADDNPLPPGVHDNQAPHDHDYHPEQVVDVEGEGIHEGRIGEHHLFEPGNDYNYVTPIRYPCCDGTKGGNTCIQDGVLLTIYHLTGGFLTFGASLISLIAIMFVFLVVSPCQYKTVMRKAWIMMRCELNPLAFKYRFLIEDYNDNSFMKMYLQIWWVILTVFRGVFHLFLAVGLFCSLIFYPIAIMHWNLAQLSLFAFNFEIVTVRQHHPRSI